MAQENEHKAVVNKCLGKKWIHKKIYLLMSAIKMAVSGEMFTQD